MSHEPRAGHHFPARPSDDGDSTDDTGGGDTGDGDTTDDADPGDETVGDANAPQRSFRAAAPVRPDDIDTGEPDTASTGVIPSGASWTHVEDIDTGGRDGGSAHRGSDSVVPSVTWRPGSDARSTGETHGVTRRQSTLQDYAPDTDDDNGALTALDIDNDADTWLDAVHTDAHPPRDVHDLDTGTINNLVVTGDLGREDNLALRALVEDADAVAANTDKDAGTVGTVWVRFGDGEYDAPEVPGDAAEATIRLSKTGSYTISGAEQFASVYAAELALFRFLDDLGVAHAERGFEISTLVMDVPLDAAESVPDDASTDLNLNAVAVLLGEYAEYEPEQYTPVKYNIAQDPDAPSRVTHADTDVTILIHPKGGLVLTGVPSAHVADAAVEYLAERLDNHDLL